MKKLRLLSIRPSKPQLETEESSTVSRLAVRLRIVPLEPTSPQTSPSPPSTRLRIPSPTPERILCFDIENKPGTYGGGDWTFPKVTAIAARFLDEERVYSWCLERNKPGRMRDDVEQFRAMWVEATVVMGHNIKRHDIKILNGLYTSLDRPLLPARRMIDTYLDQPKMSGISRSLENLGARWDSPVQKVHMSEADWEAAYDGIPWAVEKMRHRCESDVQLNIWLYHELRRRGLVLGP